MKYVTKNSLMSGYDNSRFGTVDVLSHAQLAQILYSKEGKPKAGDSPFEDVVPSLWYAQAVAWASEKDIVKGYNKNSSALRIPLPANNLRLCFGGTLEVLTVAVIWIALPMGSRHTLGLWMPFTGQ